MSTSDVDDLIAHDDLTQRLSTVAKASTKPACRSACKQSCLTTLPEDISNKIIGHLHCTLRKEPKANKWPGVTQVMNDELKPHFSYSQPEVPKLNSIQALGATSRYFYQLCLPFLWKNLDFPTALPVSMRFFTEKLLRKHGCLVRSLKVKLSTDWFDNPVSNPSANKIYDNMIIFSDATTHTRIITRPEGRPQCLSPASLAKILQECPNLDTFNIECPTYYTVIPERQWLEAFLSQLITMVTPLTNLRHLGIDSQLSYPLPDASIVEIINHLPILESLSISNIFSSDNSQLGSSLSKLTYLSHLRLRAVDSVDLSWRSHPGPPALRRLEIGFCKNLRLSTAPQVISSFGSHLTHLELKLSEPWNLTSADKADLKNFDPESNIEDHRFELPQLISLTLLDRSGADYLRTFQNCFSLRQLILYLSPSNDPCSLVSLVVSNTLPRLISLEAYYRPCRKGSEADHIEDSKAYLQEYCDQMGIGLRF